MQRESRLVRRVYCHKCYLTGGRSLGKCVLEGLVHLNLDSGGSLLLLRSIASSDLLGLSEVGTDGLQDTSENPRLFR